MSIERCRVLLDIVMSLTPDDLRDAAVRAMLHKIRKQLDRLLEQAERGRR